jgi:glycosyltransferase involved in cell wall biosynthesis
VKKTVVIVQRRLTHYREILFEKLKGSLRDRDIFLRLLAGKGTEQEEGKRDSGHIRWAENLATRYWMNGKICWQPTHRYLKNSDLVIVTQENAQIANQLLILSPFRPKVAFWGHGINFQSRNPDGLKERYKSWVSRRVDWWFAYTSLSADAVTRTGFDPARVTVLNNAVEIEGADSIGSAGFEAEIELLRETLGFGFGPVGIFIGSLYRDKRLGFLFSALDAIKERAPEFGFVFVGDGPERDAVERFCRERDWAVWVGPKFGREKLLHLSIARVMLNPGAVGLGILDSFVTGSPMVTTDCKLHGPEIAYLADGENGRMTEDSLSGFVDSAVQILTDDEEWRKLREGASRSARDYTLEKMVDRFTAGICKALGVPDGLGTQLREPHE